MAEDKPHDLLIEHLELILSRAKEYLYHDFKTAVATPKMKLAAHLQEITELSRNGYYDNPPPAEVEEELRLIMECAECSEVFLQLKGRATIKWPSSDDAIEYECHCGCTEYREIRYDKSTTELLKEMGANER